MSKATKAVLPKTPVTLREVMASLLALALAILVSCGGGGGGGSTSTGPSNPVPSITSLSPSSVTAGAAAQTLTITGSDFLSSSTVTYNGAAHTATFVSSTQLTISLSASDQATAGTYPVVVTNPSPGGGASNAVDFNVNLVMPAFSTTPAQNGAVILAMIPNTSGAVVHYTIDGSTPTTSSPIYQTPMLISSNLTINAISTSGGVPSSSMATWTPPTAVVPGSLVWSDQFTNTTGAIAQPNPAVWTYDTGAGGWGNDELETYCAWDSSVSPCNAADPNVYVGTAGNLYIVAYNPSSGVYTSARMKSEGLFSILYGRVEASIMVPEAQGFWPAFWMLGNNIVTDGWPACGEADIQERIDAAANPDWNAGSIHGTGFTGGLLGTEYYFLSPQTAGELQTYGMIWQPGLIQYYIGDPTNIYATYTPASLSSISGAVWPFDSGNGMFFIINLAVGGDWPGSPSSTTPFPSQTQANYVSVYAYSTPVSTLPTVSSLSFSPPSVAAGATTTGTVTLSGAAPTGGAAVNLSTNNINVLTLPAGGVTVPAGSTSAPFTAIASASLSSSATLTVTATYNNSSQTQTVTLTTAAGTSNVRPQRAATTSRLVVHPP